MSRNLPLLTMIAIILLAIYYIGCGSPPSDCRQTKCPSGYECVLGVQPKQIGFTIEGEKVWHCKAYK